MPTPSDPHPDDCRCDECAADATMEGRQFTPEHRKKLAKKGVALPDGSFPIVTADDLHNAVRAIGRAADPAVARAHVIKRAKALGLTRTLPAAWNIQADADDPSPETDPTTGDGQNDPTELLSFAAEAGCIFASELAHPNCAPFKMVLHQVDQPSTRPPSGAGGRRVMIPRAVAERCAHTIVNMGLNATTGLGGHQVTKKIGVITAAAVGVDPAPQIRVPRFKPDPNALMVAGCLYAKDFPAEVAAIQAASADGSLGGSYEIVKGKRRDPNAPIWVLDDLVYTGAAALDRDAAAYEDTHLAAEKETPMTMPAVDPNKPTSPAPTVPDPMEERIAARIAAAMDGIRQEFSARLQGVEAAVAGLKTRPGESPDEMRMREQAQTMDTEAARLAPQILTKKEEATALRAEGKTAEATSAEQAASTLEEQAATLRANAENLRGRAFGYGPVIQAMAGLITDGLATLQKKLATDLGTRIDKIGDKLATDPGGPGGAAGNGRQVPAPQPPERLSLSAGAMRLASKFENVSERGVTEAQLNTAMRDSGVPTDHQVALLSEFARAGLLRG